MWYVFPGHVLPAGESLHTGPLKPLQSPSPLPHSNPHRMLLWISETTHLLSWLVARWQAVARDLARCTLAHVQEARIGGMAYACADGDRMVEASVAYACAQH